MMLTDSDRRGVEETYLSAGNTSNLTVEADRRCDGDVLIAAGWSAGQFGGALMRLRSEFDGAARLPGMGKTDFLLLMDKLKSFRAAQEMAASVTAAWGAQEPQKLADAVIWWWLDKTCHSCDGLKFQRIAGAPVLSAKACRACQASGEARLPGGEMGKRLENYLDDLVSSARSRIRKRLQNEFHKA